MKYFIDTEFLEGTQKENFPISLFRKKTPSTIDLISIGIVSEDGREYYSISKDFNLKEAWNRYDELDTYTNNEWNKDYWIRNNVLLPIWKDLFFKADSCSGLSNKQAERFYLGVNNGEYNQYFTFKSLKHLINKFGKNNTKIAKEIKEFIYPLEQWRDLHQGSFIDGRHGLCLSLGVHAKVDDLLVYSIPQIESSDFYAYYADYDWVVFCWLFGNMMTLPKGFPMYCRDLKQMLDEKVELLTDKVAGDIIVKQILSNNKSIALEHPTYFTGASFKSIKDVPNFPKQENEHHALADARWNKKLYEFLMNIN